MNGEHLVANLNLMDERVRGIHVDDGTSTNSRIHQLDKTLALLSSRVEDHHREQTETANSIKTIVTNTNGTVKKHERWLAFITGAVVVLYPIVVYIAKVLADYGMSKLLGIQVK